jgi:superfamily II DNA helicase RecQ
VILIIVTFLTPEQALSEKWEKGFRKLKEKEQIGFLAIDELHCFTQSNADFRPEYLNLPILKTRLAVATSLFTATPTNDVRTAALATFGIEHRLAQEDLNRGEIFLGVHLAGNVSNLGNVDFFFSSFQHVPCRLGSLHQESYCGADESGKKALCGDHFGIGDGTIFRC